MRHAQMQAAFKAVRHMRMKFAELFAVTEILGAVDRPQRRAKTTANVRAKFLTADDSDVRMHYC